MTRKYIRRSKALVNLAWIDEEAHEQILDLWNRVPKETRPPGPHLTQGYDHDPALKHYSFGREIQRYHGNGLSYNYLSFTVNLEKQTLDIRVLNYQSQNHAEPALPLTALPRDPGTFFEQIKAAPGFTSQKRVLSFNRTSIEECWAGLLGAIDLLPKYEIERMHEITDYDS